MDPESIFPKLSGMVGIWLGKVLGGQKTSKNGFFATGWPTAVSEAKLGTIRNSVFFASFGPLTAVGHPEAKKPRF